MNRRHKVLLRTRRVNCGLPSHPGRNSGRPNGRYRHGKTARRAMNAVMRFFGALLSNKSGRKSYRLMQTHAAAKKAGAR